MKSAARWAIVSLVATGLFPISTPAFAVVPSLTSISGPAAQPVGSVAGGYDVRLLGEDFCDGSTPDVSGVTIGSTALTSLTVSCDVSGTEDEAIGTMPPQPLASREIGRRLVQVETSAGTNSNQVYFGFIPEVDESYSTSELVELGELFSRSQRKPIVRSRTAPYTVTGYDSITGLPYTYITNYDYLSGLDCADPNDAESCGAYSHEADLGEAFHPGALDTVVLDGGLDTRFGLTQYADSFNAPQSVDTSFGSLDFDVWLDGRSVTELFSDLDCDPNNLRPTPDNYFDSGDGDGPKYSFCSGFGPDIYSEPFVASDGQSLAFEWAAIGASDDYAVYAYLVKVDPATGQIPSTASPENHELVMFNSGSRNGTSDWQTSTVDVTDGGTYRFRFVNGTYDGTGGYALGSLFYLNSFFLAGDTNEIAFGEFDDVVFDLGVLTSSPEITVTASSTAGGEISVISLDQSVCTVASTNISPPTFLVTIVASPGTCILQASQGQIGSYAPAESVITAFEIYQTTQVPGAPTLLEVSGTSQSTLGNEFLAGPSGGQAITGYEYSLDGGSWVSISPTPSTGSFVIAGLSAQTTYSVQIRAVNPVGPGQGSNIVSGTTLAAPSTPPNNTLPEARPYDGPEITSITPNVVNTSGGQLIQVVGRRLGVGDHVTVGGVRVPLVSSSTTGFSFVMPALSAQVVDKVYSYDGGAQFTYMNAITVISLAVTPVTPADPGSAGPVTPEPPARPWSETEIASKFAPGSSVINSAVRKEVSLMLRKHARFATTIQCTGFTMGPTVLRVDAKLSSDRAANVCRLIKQLRPKLNVVSTKGQQEIRLGGEIRRVEVRFSR